jgi:hypothetical protein
VAKTPNQVLQQTAHANKASSSFSILARVSRLLSMSFGGAVKTMAKKKHQPEPVVDRAGTEEDWLSARGPRDLLGQLFWLNEQGRICTSERKRCLFQVACLRRVRHVFRDERSRVAVDDIEQYAEGLITHEELFQRGSSTVNPPNPDNLSEVPKEACSPEQLRVSYAWDALEVAGPQAHGIYNFQDAHEGTETVTWSAAQAVTKPEEEEEVQARLLRDIFGNPFRPVVLDPALPTTAVTSLARAAYEECALPTGELDQTRLAVLADALEEAGCTEQTILGHLRGPGLHVRGCWLVDLVLAKE